MRILLVVTTLIGGGGLAAAAAAPKQHVNSWDSYPQSFEAFVNAMNLKDYREIAQIDADNDPLWKIVSFAQSESVSDEDLADAINLFASLQDPSDRIAYTLTVENCQYSPYSKADCFVQSKQQYLQAASHIRKNIGKHGP